MTYTLLHHSGCSTSRKGLALLQENGVEPEVRKYMNASEQLSLDELKDIAKKMGASSPREFLRDKIFQAMAANPKIIQRPIGIVGKQAVLGRPIEKLLELK